MESGAYKLTFQKAKAHFLTITRHRRAVRRHCFRCGLIWQGLVHDLSKYSPSEFLVGAIYYQGNRSPNDAERRDTGASTSWMHHKGRNKHHYEYWIDYCFGETQPRYVSVPMPNRYIIEMLCDRVAACETYNKGKFDRSQPLAYFERFVPDKLMHPETARKLHKLLVLYAEKGDEAFDIIRKEIHKRKPGL